MTIANRVPLANAEAIASHYGRGRADSAGNHQIKCPVHQPHEGQGFNLSVKDAPGGGLLLHCFSRECSFNDILEAFRRDGLAINREWTYPNDKVVRRQDSASHKKGRTFKHSDGQAVKGTPLLIRGDGPDALIVITEGESDADALLAANLDGVAAGSFAGGWGNGGDADYKAVAGRRVAIWADYDRLGATAQTEAAKAAMDAGAALVDIIPWVGASGDGNGAADLKPEAIGVWVEARFPFDPTAVLDLDGLFPLGPDVEAGAGPADAEAAPARRNWLWRNLADFADIPAPVHLVDGLLIEGNITLWYAPSKTGKTRMLFGMLKSLAPGGPQFCGMDLPDFPALLFTEEPPNVIGERVRDYQIPVAGMHLANEAAALAMRPDDFAETILQSYHANGAGFGLVAVDTIGPFINNADWNDYASTTAAMAPLRQLARQLPKVAILLLHHQNKGGGSDWAGALGSTALPANADQLVRMSKAKNGQHTITVGGRNKPGPFPFDEPTTINISADGVEFVGTAADAAGESIGEYLAAEPTTIKELQEAMQSGMGDNAPSRDALAKAVKAMVAAGTMELVTAGRGTKPAVYRRMD